MKKEIDFTIIIPTYNRENFILNTIQSVLAQDYKNFEVIIIDDGSTDNTKKIVEAIQDERLIYVFKTNEERAVARNTGIKMARGKYVTFLDSDDVLFPNHFTVAKRFLEQHNSVECFHLSYQIRNYTTNKITNVPVKNTIANKQLIEGNLLSCNGVFLRNDIAISNLFNEDRALTTLEDWELWLRIAVKYSIHIEKTVTSEIIDHENRSVNLTDRDKLITKFKIFMDLVLNNPEIQRYYSKDINKFKTSCLTYISLHLALTKKNKSDSLKYLLKGIMYSPAFIFKRRFLAIIKHILI